MNMNIEYNQMSTTDSTVLCSVVVKGFSPVPECISWVFYTVQPLQIILNIQGKDLSVW